MPPVVEPFVAYMNAFTELSSCRMIGMDVGPIPFTAIVQYFTIYPIGDFPDFLYLIRRMDKVYLKRDATSNEQSKVKPGDKANATLKESR